MSLELGNADLGENAGGCGFSWLTQQPGGGPCSAKGCGPSQGLFQCMLRPLFSSSPNFYILDEPTNHLDMETIEALAKALNKFRVRLPR